MSKILFHKTEKCHPERIRLSRRSRGIPFLLRLATGERDSSTSSPSQTRLWSVGMTYFILLILIQLLNPTNTLAAKKRVFKTTVATVVATKPTISVQIRKDRRAITVIFNNLSTTTNNDYELTYNGNEIEQGVVGSVKPEEGNYSTRLLLFGTCSHNTCSYHRNVNTTVLKTTSKLKTGKKLIKTFKIKV